LTKAEKVLPYNQEVKKLGNEASAKGGSKMTADTSKDKEKVVCVKRDADGKCIELSVNEWDEGHIPGGYVGG
jgi:hypothetical protein